MKKQMKRGAFSPYLKCRMDLYNSPEIQQLRHDKAAEGFGCLMVIALDLMGYDWRLCPDLPQVKILYHEHYHGLRTVRL